MNKVEAQLIAVTLRHQVHTSAEARPPHHLGEAHHRPGSVVLDIHSETDRVSVKELKKFDHDIEHPNLSIISAADLLLSFAPGAVIVDQVLLDGEVLWEA